MSIPIDSLSLISKAKRTTSRTYLQNMGAFHLTELAGQTGQFESRISISLKNCFYNSIKMMRVIYELTSLGTQFEKIMAYYLRIGAVSSACQADKWKALFQTRFDRSQLRSCHANFNTIAAFILKTHCPSLTNLSKERNTFSGHASSGSSSIKTSTRQIMRSSA